MCTGTPFAKSVTKTAYESLRRSNPCHASIGVSALPTRATPFTPAAYVWTMDGANPFGDDGDGGDGGRGGGDSFHEASDADDHDDLGPLGPGARLMADSTYGEESDNPFAGAHDGDDDEVRRPVAHVWSLPH